MGLDAYYMVMSQPSRTVFMFLEHNKIKFNKKPLNLLKGENKTPEYLAINPHHTVPAISDDGFNICQSSAIIKYLCAKYKVADHWYPADLKKRAQVDEILDWYPSTIRKHGINVFFYIAVGPHIGLGTLTAEDIDNRYKELDDALTTMETVYLKDKKFLTGDQMTIADLFCANEVFQPTFCERDIFKNHPRLKAWFDRVCAAMNPVWDTTIAEFNAFVKAIGK